MFYNVKNFVAFDPVIIILYLVFIAKIFCKTSTVFVTIFDPLKKAVGLDL